MFFNFLLATLACYRLSRLLAWDEGPAIGSGSGVFLKLRTVAGGYDYAPNGQAKTNLGRGITCPHCWGVWIALALALIMFPFDWYMLVYWLAIAGSQSFLQIWSDDA